MALFDKRILEKANDELMNNSLRPSLLNLLELLHSEKFISDDKDYIEIKFNIENLFIQDSKPIKTNTEFYTPNEIRNLFSDKIKYKDNEEKFTTPLIVALSFFCLYKQVEIFKLKLNDIDMENKTIRNIRYHEDSNLTEYIKMNNQLHNIINKYLEYRYSLNLPFDSLVIYEGRPASETPNSLNYLLGVYKRKDNIHYINNKAISMDILMRSMILYTLEKEDILGLAKILLLQKENKYIKYALDEYVEVKKVSIDFESLSPLSLEELVPISNITNNFKNVDTSLKEQNNENYNEIYIDNNLTPYSPENDINFTDLEEYPLENKHNLDNTKVTIQRLVRDSNIAKKLKALYNYECQLCGFKLPKSDGGFLAEAHHIQPYNKTHLGDDTSLNLIVLCPNCHAQFDDFYFAINPKTLQVHCLNHEDDYHLYNIEFKHELDNKYLEYAWNIFSDKQKVYQNSKVAQSLI